jgi:CelD/BcsL family acetyltransferase involved in cellulose biosynthesis
LNIDIVRPRELSADEIARWNALQAADPDVANPFYSARWPRAVEQAQGDSCGVRVAVLHDRGQIKGFFPAKIQGAVAMPAGAPMCDYQGLVAASDVTVDPRALLAAFGVGRYDFSHMPESQGAFSAHVRGASPSWIVRLPFGYDVYAADKKEESGIIKDMDKRRRKADRELGPVTFTAFSRSKTDFEQMIAWKRANYRSTGQTDIFDSEWTLHLLRELFASRDPAFGGAFYTLHIGDRLAAAQFHLRGSDVIHAWIIAHECEFERVSPGLLLFQDILRWMDDTPYTSIDFGPGDYRFKQQLANDTCSVGHGFIGRPGASSFVRSAAYGIREVAERLPLGGVSELPGKAMRRLDLIRALR